MGITWRFTMPLLSTLAALVIIVHSAEEDNERNYQDPYAMNSRILDPASGNYEQSWRMLEAEPMMQQSMQADPWHVSNEEPLQRRRPARKRKRRPIHDDLTPEERRVYPEEPVRYQEEYKETTEMPRRRRKKPENRRYRWPNEYRENDRPLRRRGHKRKRPSNENWQRASEIDEAPRNTFDREIEENPFASLPNKQDTTIKEQYVNEPLSEDTRTRTTDAMLDGNDDVQQKEDISLVELISELSVEDKSRDSLVLETFPEQKIVEITPPMPLDKAMTSTEDSYPNKLNAQTPEQSVSVKGKITSPIDSMDIKELLKRSNGTSLSEILQQHNLSLSDLLSGNENAISVLKPENQEQNRIQSKGSEDTSNSARKNESEQEETENAKNNKDSTSETDIEVYVSKSQLNITKSEKDDDLETQNTGKLHENLQVQLTLPKIAAKRRYPEGIRRKLRLNPRLNQNSLKGQLNRDLIAQTARKYHNNRNMTKSKEWRQVLSVMNMSTISKENNKNENPEALITTATPDETTSISTEFQTTPITETETIGPNITDVEVEFITTETPQFPTEEIQEITTIEPTSTTEKPKVNRVSRPVANHMGLRQQAFNNRLKRKRIKQKNLTTEIPAEKEDLKDDLYTNIGLPEPNLMSSSEFVAQTQTPQPTKVDSEFTALEDFMTTEKPKQADNRQKHIRNSTTTVKNPEVNMVRSTTEESAKIEIEEILNDTRASARLSKILMERNMTLNELVEHRERGSSQVHLADIFHNASKEPNPPEPFLSKSSIEPISKETYPLRALLDANLHDPSIRVTTVDPGPSQPHYVNIPVVMDFGNNVNEIGENMGIMSLFNKLAGDSNIENNDLKKDSKGVPYVATVTTVNTTQSNDTVREGRVLNEENNNLKQDVVGWNKLFELMRVYNRNTSNSDLPQPAEELSPSESNKIFIEDLDGDGLIVLEDLQHLREEEMVEPVMLGDKVDVSYVERAEVTVSPGILDKSPNNTRSVTVATACIAGLSMILFLLTYAAFKWKQQRKILRKKQSFHDERIPTPVFENRKGHKNNSSTRSISPMLNTSNIYTMNTLDSQNGKESPDYMWDSLRKPFQ